MTAFILGFEVQVKITSKITLTMKDFEILPSLKDIIDTVTA